LNFKLPFMKKSVRFSELLPTWMFNPNNAKWADWSTDRAIQYGYKSNTYVYACVNLLAKSAASIPWQVYAKTKTKTWEVIEDHPAALLIEKPNPFMSRTDLIEIMTMHLYLGGNALLTKVRGGGVVSELWPLPPDAMKVIPDKQNYIGGYFYDRDGVRMRFNPSDIIHNKFNDPANPYWGIAPLQAGAKLVDTDNEAVEWNKIALENRAITDGVFTFDSPLTKDQWDDARKQVREQHQGIQNARTPWVLGAGAKWQQMSLSPAEMDFINSRKMTREEICAIFGCPPVMIGIYENATLANIQTARRIFWQDTVVPFLENMKSCFNLQLTPEYGGDIYIDFDLSAVEALQDNFNDKITNARALWGMGVPFNAINQRLELGFDDVDSGDVGFLPTSVIPADSAMNPPPAPAPAAALPPPPAPKASGKGITGGDENKALNLPSIAHKDHYVKGFESRRASWDLNLTRKASNMFLNEADSVINALKRYPSTEAGIALALDSAIKNEEWNRYFVSTWTGIVEEFASETFNGLKNQTGRETKAFEFLTNTIKNYIIRTAALKVVGVTEFTKSVIGGLVLNVFNQPESNTMDDVAKAVKSTYQDFSRYRAYRIGRTEVAGATNYGSMIGAKASGIALKKEWLSAHDERVRKSHAHVDGEVVGLDEKFSNGLHFPAEYEAGRPSETIHCRCVLVYSTD
jgi:HK97 family phage portal protein